MVKHSRSFTFYTFSVVFHFHSVFVLRNLHFFICRTRGIAFLPSVIGFVVRVRNPITSISNRSECQLRTRITLLPKCNACTINANWSSRTFFRELWIKSPFANMTGKMTNFIPISCTIFLEKLGCCGSILWFCGDDCLFTVPKSWNGVSNCWFADIRKGTRVNPSDCSIS